MTLMVWVLPSARSARLVVIRLLAWVDRCRMRWLRGRRHRVQLRTERVLGCRPCLAIHGRRRASRAPHARGLGRWLFHHCEQLESHRPFLATAGRGSFDDRMMVGIRCWAFAVFRDNDRKKSPRLRQRESSRLAAEATGIPPTRQQRAAQQLRILSSICRRRDQCNILARAAAHAGWACRGICHCTRALHRLLYHRPGGCSLRRMVRWPYLLHNDFYRGCAR